VFATDEHHGNLECAGKAKRRRRFGFGVPRLRGVTNQSADWRSTSSLKPITPVAIAPGNFATATECKRCHVRIHQPEPAETLSPELLSGLFCTTQIVPGVHAFASLRELIFQDSSLSRKGAEPQK